MSSITIHAVAQADQAAQAAQAAQAGPNWVLIGIIIGVVVILAIVFLIPNKKPAIEDKDKKDKLPAEGDKKALEDKSKEDLSLAEVKESKRAAVSEDKTKEELRELRKERRAATQTEKAVHDREQAAQDGADAGKSDADASKVEAASADDTAKDVADAKADATDAAKDDASKADAAKDDAAKDDAKDSKSLDGSLGVANELLGKADADSADVFASLFGGGKELDFDAEIGNSSNTADGPVIPTLGSALISLDDLTKAAEIDKEASGDDEFAGLAMFVGGSSEKKTPE